jgi:hypothetical protein
MFQSFMRAELIRYVVTNSTACDYPPPPHTHTRTATPYPRVWQPLLHHLCGGHVAVRYKVGWLQRGAYVWDRWLNCTCAQLWGVLVIDIPVFHVCKTVLWGPDSSSPACGLRMAWLFVGPLPGRGSYRSA